MEGDSTTWSWRLWQHARIKDLWCQFTIRHKMQIIRTERIKSSMDLPPSILANEEVRRRASEIVSIDWVWVVVKGQHIMQHTFTLTQIDGGLCRWCQWFCGWKGPMISEQQPPTMEASFTRRKYGRGGYLLGWRLIKEEQRDLSSCISVLSIDSMLWVYCKKCRNWGPFPL
jgi:hypothetical protein